MDADIIIKITFPIDEPEKFQIETNAKTELVGELLADYIRTQMGAGKDDSPPNEVDVYEITIGIDLSDDTWGTNHNCGNKGLRDGIIMDVINRISKSENTEWLKA